MLFTTDMSGMRGWDGSPCSLSAMQNRERFGHEEAAFSPSSFAYIVVTDAERYRVCEM